MWLVYRIELYPHVAGFGSGIIDEHGNELELPAAFRTGQFVFSKRSTFA